MTCCCFCGEGISVTGSGIWKRTGDFGAQLTCFRSPASPPLHLPLGPDGWIARPLHGRYVWR